MKRKLPKKRFMLPKQLLRKPKLPPLLQQKQPPRSLMMHLLRSRKLPLKQLLRRLLRPLKKPRRKKVKRKPPSRLPMQRRRLLWPLKPKLRLKLPRL